MAAKIGKQRIRTLFCNNLFQTLYVQGLNISNICCLRIGHDGSRVGINQHNFITEISQSLAGLSSGIVKLTGLTNDNRAGPNNKYLMNIRSLWHKWYPPFFLI